MHSVLIILACASYALIELAGLGLSRPFAVIALAVMVGVLGVPHGALDHQAGRDLLWPRFGNAWPVVFLTAYTGLGVLVIAGWYWLTAVTILVFFLLSAWHFGMEERDAAGLGNWADQLTAIACGGMVIWIPALFQPNTVTDLLVLVIPGDGFQPAAFAVQVTRIAGLVLAPLLVLGLPREFGKSADRLTISRTAALALLFAIASPLVSFGVYFCGWHSVRGLADLHKEVGGTAQSLARKLMPLTGITLIMAIGACWYWSQNGSWTSATLRSVFIGLSAIAIPHLLLHIITDLRSNAGTTCRSPGPLGVAR